MKNTKNLLALSLLLSISSIDYAMEDNAGFNQIIKQAENNIETVAEKLLNQDVSTEVTDKVTEKLAEEASDQVIEKVTDQVVQQSWFSNLLTWTRYLTWARSSLSTVQVGYQDYIEPALQDAGSRISTGYEQAGVGAALIGQFAERNPQAVAALAFAATIGSWILLNRYMNPSMTAEERQAAIDQFIVEHQPELDQIEVDRRAKIAAEKARQEEIAKMNWSEYANLYNPWAVR